MDAISLKALLEKDSKQLKVISEEIYEHTRQICFELNGKVLLFDSKATLAKLLVHQASKDKKRGIDVSNIDIHSDKHGANLLQLFAEDVYYYCVATRSYYNLKESGALDKYNMLQLICDEINDTSISCDDWNTIDDIYHGFTSYCVYKALTDVKSEIAKLVLKNLFTDDGVHTEDSKEEVLKNYTLVVDTDDLNELINKSMKVKRLLDSDPYKLYSSFLSDCISDNLEIKDLVFAIGQDLGYNGYKNCSDMVNQVGMELFEKVISEIKKFENKKVQ